MRRRNHSVILNVGAGSRSTRGWWQTVASTPRANILSGKQGKVFVSTTGSTSPSKPLTRAEQEVQSAAERLNMQTEAALAAVAARQTPGGVDELEASADRLERAARDLSVALRELVEERREKDKQL